MAVADGSEVLAALISHIFVFFPFVVMSLMRKFLGPKSQRWNPAVTRSYYNFKFYGTETTINPRAVGGPEPNPAGSVGYPILVGNEADNDPQFPVLGVPQKPLYFAGLVASAVADHWNTAKTIFYKTITPKFSCSWSLDVRYTPTRTYLQGGVGSTTMANFIRNAIPRESPRLLIVVERCLFNQPTAAQLKSNAIPFGRLADGTMINNDSSWRHFLRNKDPRLMWFMILDFDRQIGQTNVQWGAINVSDTTTASTKNQVARVTTPIFDCLAWAADPSFGDVTVNQNADMNSFFQQPLNYPLTAGNVLPQGQEPCFYRCFDITNSQDWFNPIPAVAVPQPQGIFTVRCDAVHVEMQTTMFMNVDVLQSVYQADKVGNSDVGSFDVGIPPPVNEIPAATFYVRGIAQD